MSPNKAPSAGTKVDLGQNAPIVQEGTGKVASESLAAESIQESGEFAANRGVRSENISSPDQSATHESSQQPKSGSEGPPKSYDGAAPTYVNSQYYQDPAGPHGKNLKEGGWDDSKVEDGLKKAFNAEPGSENDPSRLAEHQFQLKQNAGGRDTGPKQEDITNKTVYDALSAEVSS